MHQGCRPVGRASPPKNRAMHCPFALNPMNYAAGPLCCAQTTGIKTLRAKPSNQFEEAV